MAKSMALIEKGVVYNIAWCPDNAQPTDSLIDIGDCPVGIGDTFTDGKFYRNGVEVLTPLEDALKQNAAYEQALSEIEAALSLGVTT